MQLEVGANENPFALLVDADKMSREKARQKDSTQCQEHIFLSSTHLFNVYLSLVQQAFLYVGFDLQ